MKTYLILFLLVFSTASILYADTTNLQRIREEVEAQEDIIKKLVEEKDNFEKDLSKIATRIDLLSDKKRAVAEELFKIESSIEEVQTKINSLEIKKRKLKAANSERFVNLYKTWKNGDVIKLKSYDYSIISFDKVSHYTNIFQAKDKKILSNFLSLEEALITKKKELILLFNDQDKLKLKLQTEKIKLEKTKKENLALIKSINKKEGKINDLLISLRAKSLRFETALTELIDYNSEGLNNKDESYLSKANRNTDNDKNLKLEGLKKDSYLFPINLKTKLIKKFGRFRDKNLNDNVFNKGLEVKIDKETDVFSITSGQVVFVGEMPSYNLVVIINHGQRDYSLYANLEKTYVSQNEELDNRVKIGEFNGNDTNNFYFEIRNNGKAVNPVSYIKNINDVLER